jgi:hypothetical protein
LEEKKTSLEVIAEEYASTLSVVSKEQTVAVEDEAAAVGAGAEDFLDDLAPDSEYNYVAMNTPFEFVSFLKI